jgi:hypothetical protein
MLLLEQYQVIDGETGELKQRAVPPPLMKTAFENVIKVLRRAEAEMGQQVAALPAVGSGMMAARLLGLDGKDGVDYRQLVENRRNRERQQQEEEAAYAREVDERSMKREVQRLENGSHLDEFCYDFIAKAVAQCGAGVLNHPDFRADPKDQFPQEERAQAEVDRWLAAIDAQVAALRAAAEPEPDPEPLLHVVPPVPEPPEPSAFISAIAIAMRGTLPLEFEPEDVAELEVSPLLAANRAAIRRSSAEHYA